MKPDKSKFQKLLDTIDNSSIQPINLTPEAILDFYIDFRQLIKEEFVDVDFQEFMGWMDKLMDIQLEKKELKLLKRLPGF